MADSKEKLFSDFAPATTEQWMDKVTADLKGADFEKKLVWKTNEGFKVKPFYRMERPRRVENDRCNFPVNSLISDGNQERQQRMAGSSGNQGGMPEGS